MGNTIFPSESLAAGLAADFDAASHPLIRLRVLHPLIAISVGLYLFLSLGLSWWLKPVPRARHVARVLFGVYMTQLLVGTLNLAFLGPVGLQLLTSAAWRCSAFSLLSALIVYTLGLPAAAEVRAATWSSRPKNRRETLVIERERYQVTPTVQRHAQRGATIVTLTKPKVISLLLLTTVGAMFIAARGFPGWLSLLGVLAGGYMSAGAAGVFNMVYDRDIDVRMKRTASRPTVTSVISSRERPYLRHPADPRFVCELSR